MSTKKSPWVYVAIGCGAITVVGVLVAILAVVWIGKTTKDMVDDMKDPVARAENVKRLLGAEALPEGYYPALAMKVPFIMEMAILSDEPVGDDGPQDGDLDGQGFMYFRLPTKINSDLRDYFEGRTDDDSVFDRNHIQLDLESKELLSRGSFQINGQDVYFVSQLGSFSTEQGRAEGIHAVIMIDCPQDEKMRLGLWFYELPEDGSDSADYLGTPADPDAVEAFMGHFRVCGSNE